MVIGDMGSFRPGVPTLTVALRGMAMITVEARTLAGPKHSGQFGCAAPEHLCAERARPDRRVREGRDGRGGLLRPLCRRGRRQE
jgi:hypothetical protein